MPDGTSPWTVLDALREAVGAPGPVLTTALRVGVVYFAVLLALRYTGRRVLGQMTPFDLLTLLLLSNVVQNAMIGPDNSLTGGLLGASVLLVANGLVARSPWLRHRLEHEPLLLVDRGRILANRLGREGISEVELLTAIREHGVGSVDEVAAAVLEMDGTISIIPRGGPDPVHIRHVRSNRSRPLP